MMMIRSSPTISSSALSFVCYPLFLPHALSLRSVVCRPRDPTRRPHFRQNYHHNRPFSTSSASASVADGNRNENAHTSTTPATKKTTAGTETTNTPALSLPRPHDPVLCDEVCDLLAPVLASSPAIYHRTHDTDLSDTRHKYRRTIVDCTLGAGGHAHAILSRFGSAIDRYIGIDKDMDALRIARKTLRHHSQVEYIHGDFRDIDRLLPADKNEDATSYSSVGNDEDAGEIIEAGDIDFVLLDAGLSSMQLSDPQRGFSFQRDGPLDMRMNRDSHDIFSSSPSSKLTAHTIINTYTEPQLCDILYHFGEERQARRLARGIHAYRKEHGTIDTTAQLAELILRIKGKGPAISPSSKTGNKKKLHPATLTFQALRLCVNGELDALNEAVPKLANRLRPDGRIAVISFHSLEDRIVKTHFRNLMAHQGGVQLVDRKPKLPSAEEIRRNPRARSAKMRCAQRLPAGFIGAKVSVNKYASKKAKRPV